jgi:hypothetical protein
MFSPVGKPLDLLVQGRTVPRPISFAHARVELGEEVRVPQHHLVRRRIRSRVPTVNPPVNKSLVAIQPPITSNAAAVDTIAIATIDAIAIAALDAIDAIAIAAANEVGRPLRQKRQLYAVSHVREWSGRVITRLSLQTAEVNGVAG